MVPKGTAGFLDVPIGILLIHSDSLYTYMYRDLGSVHPLSDLILNGLCLGHASEVNCAAVSAEGAVTPALSRVAADRHLWFAYMAVGFRMSQTCKIVRFVLWGNAASCLRRRWLPWPLGNNTVVTGSKLQSRA